MQPLVSIIIPTYNRGHLIGETLHSVILQTYTNWECIVIDDGSTDNTEQILQGFIEADKRFGYHKRPNNRPKGANACRNYGLEISKGSLIQWFDSDDIMLADFLKIKVQKVETDKCDFVFSKTLDILDDGTEKPMFYKNIDDYVIDGDNFVQQNIVWCTLDFLCTKKSIKNVRFNETLHSGQEFNFFSNYLFNNVKGLYVDAVLAKRRVHSNSIQQKQNKSKTKYRKNKYLVYLTTLMEIKNVANNDSLKHLLNLSMGRAFEMAHNSESIPKFRVLLKNTLQLKGVVKALIFLLSILLSKYFKKGYGLMEFSRN